MRDDDGDDAKARRPTGAEAKPTGALERALIPAWRAGLQADGFTDHQAARLIMTKLLYLRRRLHR